MEMEVLHLKMDQMKMEMYRQEQQQQIKPQYVINDTMKEMEN